MYKAIFIIFLAGCSFEKPLYLKQMEVLCTQTYKTSDTFVDCVCHQPNRAAAYCIVTNADKGKVDVKSVTCSLDWEKCK